MKTLFSALILVFLVGCSQPVFYGENDIEKSPAIGELIYPKDGTYYSANTSEGIKTYRSTDSKDLPILISNGVIFPVMDLNPVTVAEVKTSTTFYRQGEWNEYSITCLESISVIDSNGNGFWVDKVDFEY